MTTPPAFSAESFQRQLDENQRLIANIIGCQQQNSLEECAEYQKKLHESLIALASFVDSMRQTLMQPRIILPQTPLLVTTSAEDKPSQPPSTAPAATRPANQLVLPTSVSVESQPQPPPPQTRAHESIVPLRASGTTSSKPAPTHAPRATSASRAPATPLDQASELIKSILTGQSSAPKLWSEEENKRLMEGARKFGINGTLFCVSHDIRISNAYVAAALDYINIAKHVRTRTPEETKRYITFYANPKLFKR